jgi:hypothetical protein
MGAAVNVRSAPERTAKLPRLSPNGAARGPIGAFARPTLAMLSSNRAAAQQPIDHHIDNLEKLA